LDDIEHRAFLRITRNESGVKRKIVRLMQLPWLIGSEARAIRKSNKSFVCSKEDRDYLAKRFRFHSICVIPNSVPIPTGCWESPHSRTMLYVGRYGHPPNVFAAEMLLNQIWPQVLKEVPEARLVIAGKRPDLIPGFGKGTPNVEFPGFVEDIEDLYRRTQLICCPILSGGGTRLKIIEAASYGKAVISTKIGAEGLNFKEGTEIIIRDKPEAIAAACIEYLQEPEKCRRIGQAARARAIQEYDKRHIIERIRKELLIP